MPIISNLPKSTALPSGGNVGQVLTKTESGEAWQDVSALPEGSAGQIVSYDNSGNAIARDMPTASEIGALPNTTKIPIKTSDLTNDSGFITNETDPTVPDWAKQPTKPAYTASEVGAAAASHTQAASTITSGTFDVSRGGTGRSTLTSGYFLRGNGTSAITMSSVSDVQSALGVAKIATGTYTGNKPRTNTTPQTINLGFAPDFVLVNCTTSSGFVWDVVPWTYWDEWDDQGDRTRQGVARAGWAFKNYPYKLNSYDTGLVDIITCTSTGFTVSNFNEEYSTTTKDYSYDYYLNYTDVVYSYIAIKVV